MSMLSWLFGRKKEERKPPREFTPRQDARKNYAQSMPDSSPQKITETSSYDPILWSTVYSQNQSFSSYVDTSPSCDTSSSYSDSSSTSCDSGSSSSSDGGGGW